MKEKSLRESSKCIAPDYGLQNLFLKSSRSQGTAEQPGSQTMHAISLPTFILESDDASSKSQNAL